MSHYGKLLAVIMAAFLVFTSSASILRIIPPTKTTPEPPAEVAAEAEAATSSGHRLGRPAEPPAPAAEAGQTPERVPERTPERKPEPDRPPMLTSRSGRRLKVTATAYTSVEAGPVTYTGVKVTPWHTVAVDPREIRLGSWVFIPFFEDRPNKGWFHAEDVGGAVKGGRIDIYMESLKDALEFGIRDLEIMVKDAPP